MNAQYFIYTRGHSTENDYKLMFSPSEDFCSKETIQFFRQQVRGAINIETYEGTLMSPRWLFSRYHGMELWGMAIMNSVIGDENTDDYTGRGVRGFFGMVMKEGALNELPIGLDFFRKMYKDLVAPRWFNSKEEFKQIGISVDIPFGPEVIRPQDYSSIGINIDPERTVILGNDHSDIEYLNAAFATNSDTSIIIGLSESAHAYDHNYHYMNARVLSISEKEEKRYAIVPPQTEVTSKKSTLIRVPDEPKKAFRPKKNMSRLIILLVLLAIVGMCIKGTKKSKHSTSSGEKTIMEQSESSQKSVMDTKMKQTE